MIKISNGRQQVSYLDKQKNNLRDPGRQYKIITSKTKQMATTFFFFFSSLLG
jgi:hypothetical protein